VLPNEPHLIATLPTLVPQTLEQITLFLIPGQVAPLPYTGTTPQFRDMVWNKQLNSHDSIVSKYAPCRRVYIASFNACAADFEAVFGSVREKKFAPTAAYLTTAEHSIHRVKFLSVNIDEGHLARNPRTKNYHGLRSVARNATAKLIATATPVFHQLSDSVSLALIVHHPSFVDEAMDEVQMRIAGLKKAHRRAVAEQRKREREIFESGLSNLDFDGSQSSSTAGTVAVYGDDFGEMFQGSIIRRNAESRDAAGIPIIGLPPLTIVNIDVDMYPQEEELLHEQLRKMESSTTGEKTTKQVMAQDFYVKIRQMSLHPYCVDIQKSATFPVDKSDYLRNPSAKIDALITILNHHFADRQALPYTRTEDQRAWTTGAWADAPADPKKVRSDGPQKVVIYQYFSSNIPMMERVRPQLPMIVITDAECQILRLHGYNVRALTGTLSMRAKNAIVEFFNNYDGQMILIISKVGTVGLNLQKADIIFVMARHICWPHCFCTDSSNRIPPGHRKKTSRSMVGSGDRVSSLSVWSTSCEQTTPRTTSSTSWPATRKLQAWRLQRTTSRSLVSPTQVTI
jgi:SNF2 family DNA or RNA helicase